jgi:hypothetical protein
MSPRLLALARACDQRSTASIVWVPPSRRRTRIVRPRSRNRSHASMAAGRLPTCDPPIVSSSSPLHNPSLAYTDRGGTERSTMAFSPLGPVRSTMRWPPLARVSESAASNSAIARMARAGGGRSQEACGAASGDAVRTSRAGSTGVGPPRSSTADEATEVSSGAGSAALPRQACNPEKAARQNQPTRTTQLATARSPFIFAT